MSVSPSLRMLGEEEEEDNLEMNRNRPTYTSPNPMSALEVMLSQMTQTLKGMDGRQKEMDGRQREMDRRQKETDERVLGISGRMNEVIGRVREVTNEQEEVRRHLSMRATDYMSLTEHNLNVGLQTQEDDGIDQNHMRGSGKVIYRSDVGEMEGERVVSEYARRSHPDPCPESNRIADKDSAAPATADLVEGEEENHPSRSRPRVRCSERLKGRSRRDYATMDRVGFRSPEEVDRLPPNSGVGVVFKQVGVAPFLATSMTTYGPNGGGTLPRETPVPTDRERLSRGEERTSKL